MQNDNGGNAGAATPGTSGAPDGGGQGANPGGSSGTPDNQNGTQTDSRDAKITQLSSEVKRLNQAVVDAKRGSRNNGQGNGQGDGNPFETPEGQYGIAIQVATSNLRNKLEDLIPLYSEGAKDPTTGQELVGLPASELARIRKNPWAFASHESFVNGDWEAASLEIEQAMLARADEIAAEKANANPNPNPANVNANPEAGGEEPTVIPGSAEDEDPWTMPMDKLEVKAKKAVAQVSKSK